MENKKKFYIDGKWVSAISKEEIKVIDPAFAPGTGTPEIAGMTSREMVNTIRGLSGLNLISADVVEVSPAYDHAEVTSLAAATIVYELTNLFAKK